MTLGCLKSLFECYIPNIYKLDVFLVDDGSTDGTSQAVTEKFPSVNIIQGNGNLYWNGGMRLAWKTAAETKDYDFYVWLNDDTILFKEGIEELFDCYNKVLKKNGSQSIITGACQEQESKKIFSYGGRTDSGPVIPNDKLQSCTYINGNVALIPKEIFLKIGNLSTDYTHGLGDFDYGLRAIEHGFECYTTSKFIAVCEPNGIPDWNNPEIKLKNRIKSLYSPQGFNLKDYIRYRKKFWGCEWVVFALKVYAKTLLPKLYKKIK